MTGSKWLQVRWLRRWLGRWDRATQAFDHVEDADLRRRSQLLASLLLAVALLVLVLFPLRYLTVYDSGEFYLRTSISTVSGLCLLALYWLSRRGHPNAAGMTAFVIGSMAIFFTAIAAPTTQVTPFYYLVIMTLFIGLFLAYHLAVMVFAVHAVGMLVLALFVDTVNLRALIQGPLVFNFIMTIAIVIFSLYRERLEAVRQAELSRSEERYRALFEQAQDAILLEDSGGHILDANPAATRLFGYQRAQLTAMNIGDLDADTTLPAPPSVKDTGRPLEWTVRRRDGQTILAESLITPLDAQQQSVYLSTIRDISERRRVERDRLQLAVERERVALLENVISDLSHDLMTPISIIKTSLYLLRRTDDEQQRLDRIGQVEHQLERLQDMIQSVLTLSRLDRGPGREYEFQWGDLNKVAARVVDNYRDAAQRGQQELVFEPDVTLSPWYFDETKLRLALANLVDNALVHTGQGTRITVRTGHITVEGQEQAILEVQDTGPGISAEDMPHILTRFYRAEKHRPTRGGAGVGLSITRKIVEGHEGVVEVHSEPGQGSIFRILLPFSTERDHADGRGPARGHERDDSVVAGD